MGAIPICLAWLTYRGYCRLWGWGEQRPPLSTVSTSTSLAVTIGDAWTSRGTTSTAGLHPTVKRGIDRMMKDNPNIRVSSGLRDTVQQRRLRAAGNSKSRASPRRTLGVSLPTSVLVVSTAWIVANAHRYGLKSGRDHGEPWHVGLPGIGDVGGHGDIGDDFPVNPNQGQVFTDRTGRRWTWNGPLNMWIPETVTGQTPVPAPPGAVPTVTGPLPQPPYSPLPTNTNPPATPPATTTPATTTPAPAEDGLGTLFDMFRTGFTRDQAIEGLGSLVPQCSTCSSASSTWVGRPTSSRSPTIRGCTPLSARRREGRKASSPLAGRTRTSPSSPAPPLTPSVEASSPVAEAVVAEAVDLLHPCVTPRAIYDYLRQQGVSEASAAGILANIKQESSFDPTNDTGDNGTSGGLFQHHAGRWAALKDYAEQPTAHWTDWHAQVDFALLTGEPKLQGINLQPYGPRGGGEIVDPGV